MVPNLTRWGRRPGVGGPRGRGRVGWREELTVAAITWPFHVIVLLFTGGFYRGRVLREPSGRLLGEGQDGFSGDLLMVHMTCHAEVYLH